MFNCKKCGKCCQSLRGADLYKDLDDGSGTCIYFNKKTKLCSIYQNRPEKCNIDLMYQKEYYKYYTKSEYERLNYIGCKKINT